jgi:Secretion system C-terminal sorting domain
MKNFDFFVVSLFTPICHTIMVGVIAIVPISTAIAQSVNHIYLNTFNVVNLRTDETIMGTRMTRIVRIYTDNQRPSAQSASSAFLSSSRSSLKLTTLEYDFGDDDVNCQGIGQRNSFDEGKLHTDENSIKLYPNPTTGMVQVEWPVPSTGGYIVLIDSFGKIILEQRFSEASRVSFQTGQLPAGVYICRVHFDDRKTHTSSVIVIR